MLIGNCILARQQRSIHCEHSDIWFLRYGGLIRDSEGEFLLGFYGTLRNQEITHVEIFALLQGITICWERGYMNVHCVSDSLDTVNYVKKGVTNHHRYSNEIVKIQNLLLQDWQCSITHNCREGNQCADFLAKLGANSGVAMMVIQEPPTGLQPLLAADAAGVSFMRAQSFCIFCFSLQL